MVLETHRFTKVRGLRNEGSKVKVVWGSVGTLSSEQREEFLSVVWHVDAVGALQINSGGWRNSFVRTVFRPGRLRRLWGRLFPR